ncbi:MAG: methyltransferase domain-containing protein [Acidimicrobiales bacterium]
MSSVWNPDTYEQFADLRAKPFDDLVSLIEPPETPPDVVDLGCGTGALTASLAERLGARSVLGIDSSPEMLERAAEHDGAGVRFERGDIATFDRPSSFDVVISNAALHWTDDHRGTLGRWARAVRPGGQIAVQLPANFAHPSHTVAVRVGQDSYFDRRWRNGGQPADRGRFVMPPAAYAELLNELGFATQSVSLHVYPMVLPSSASVVDWVRGTLLVPYRAALAPDDYAEFERRYAKELALVIGGESGERSPYFYAFDRILMWGRRAR